MDDDKLKFAHIELEDKAGNSMRGRDILWAQRCVTIEPPSMYRGNEGPGSAVAQILVLEGHDAVGSMALTVKDWLPVIDDALIALKKGRVDTEPRSVEGFGFTSDAAGRCCIGFGRREYIVVRKEYVRSDGGWGESGEAELTRDELLAIQDACRHFLAKAKKDEVRGR